MMENEEEFDSLTAEKKLLYASRNGHVRIVEELLQQKRAGEIELDVNCRGTSRANKGWSPLHLSTYFGHKDVVQLLLEGGADVNTQNNMGDTPLHRAAHTGREEVVMMLLNHGADVSIMNTDGKTAKYVATQNVQRLIEGSEQCDTRKIVDDFLTAALYGEVDTICELLKRPNAPAINCTDKFGNTALHMAALRNQKEVSILLLQNGIDSGIKNNKDKRAEEYTQAPQMKQLLKVQPVRDIQSIPSRCEGPLLKKSRFFGFKMFWVVLEKGVMSYFNNKGDARTGSRRKGMKCLYEATVESFSENSLQFRIHFSDGTYHTLCTDPLKGDFIVRQHWLNSLNEHTAYSNHYMQQSEISDDDKDDEIVPLGSLLESLQIAQAHQQLLDQQLTNVSCLFNNLETQNPKTANFLLIHQNFCQILGTSHEMYAALSCSLKMFNNQDKVRELQLMQEREKSRVLQEALHALATEHHELEQSISTRNFPRRFYDTDDDEFYDCDNDIQSSDSIADFTSVNGDAFFESCSNCTSTPDSSLMPQGNTSNAAFWLFPYGPQSYTVLSEETHF